MGERIAAHGADIARDARLQRIAEVEQKCPTSNPSVREQDVTGRIFVFRVMRHCSRGTDAKRSPTRP